MAGTPRLVLGTRKGLLTITKTNGRWLVDDESHRGARVPYAFVDKRSNQLWATIDHGHFGAKLLRRSTDGEWMELDAPQYPAGEKLNNGKDAVLKYLWCLAPCPHNSDRMFVGTEPGGLFVTNDQGASFELVEGLWNHPSRLEEWQGGGLDQPGIHSVFVDPRDENHILVGISVAGVFETCDGGATWNPANKGLMADFLPNPESEIGHDPHYMTACASNLDVLWQQNHCGVFRSVDCGKTWERVSSGDRWAHFGFTIAVDPQDADVAWVIPAESDMVRVAIDQKLGVGRTTDGGKTWERLTNGLPQTLCYDFALRHALDVQHDQLAFGTSCGSVYYSNDRGDHWTCVGTDFPQIYSVRFA